MFNLLCNFEYDFSFETAGLFHGTVGRFELDFKVVIFKKGHPQDFVFKASVIASFKFNRPLKKEEIPEYFYKNSLAIAFPYVRAFLTTLSVMGNNRPLILPLLNLSSLEQPLRENTNEVIDTPPEEKTDVPS